MSSPYDDGWLLGIFDDSPEGILPTKEHSSEQHLVVSQGLSREPTPLGPLGVRQEPAARPTTLR